MVPSMDRWVSKVAVVTGASAGIGAAIADSLVELGLIVFGKRPNLTEERSKIFECHQILTAELSGVCFVDT